MKTYDVVIVGGGLIGLSIAFELAPNLRVVILDRQQPGREASWAAAGMLSPAPESASDAVLVPLALASLAQYPDFIAAVEAASGKSAGYVRTGSLEFIFSPTADDGHRERAARYRALGISAEVVSTQVDAAGSADGIRDAIWLPDEATVDPRALTEAVLAAAESRGVEIRSGCSATGLEFAGGRCQGVIAGGEQFAAANVVMAAGCFSREIFAGDDRLARLAPTRPVRGQMISFRDPGTPLKTILRSEAGYVVPRLDGRIVAGSTSEEAGFEKRVTPEGIRKITEAAIELMPSLAQAEVAETWCGLRPGTPDDLPILGPTGTPGLLMATGHYRNGILLAPATAKLMKDWILGSDEVSIETEAFSPLRFAGDGLTPACQELAPGTACRAPAENGATESRD